MSGSPTGSDEESLKAGVILLHDIETRQVLLELLHEHKLHAQIGENGVPDFYPCDGECQTTAENV